MGYRSQQARFSLLVEACSTDLYRYAAWLCGDRAQAEDLVQETYMRAWQSLQGLKYKGAVKLWLFGLLRREHVRSNACRSPESARSLVESVAEAGPYNINSETCVLRRALAALAVEYREPLALQVIGGLSSEEIAQLLEVSPTTVLMCLLRGRRQLRDALGDVRHRGSSKVMA
jgi:RNA polymerase sigma-70 factor, ECF subfamily